MKLYLGRKTAAAVLTLLAVGGAITVAATQGSQTDPLVTLSYLTDVFTPSVLTQVDTQVAQNRQDYLDKLDASVSGYSTQMEELLGGLSGSAAQSSSAFSVVDLAQGQKLTGGVGCEVLLRVGTASCVSPGSPGLIDSTDGSTLENGKALVKNHLYLFTIEGRSISAGTAVKVLVRGTYSVG